MFLSVVLSVSPLGKAPPDGQWSNPISADILVYQGCRHLNPRFSSTWELERKLNESYRFCAQLS